MRQRRGREIIGLKIKEEEEEGEGCDSDPDFVPTPSHKRRKLRNTK